ncbi:MAG: GNAT family N-acetyltransferase [Parvibaculaceae bacterium]
MKVRKATMDDAEAATLVLRRSIIELCLQDHGNDRAVLQTWLANKTPERFREWARAADDLCLVAAAGDGAILGVAYLSKAGEIKLNYVSPDARLQGVSSVLIAAIETEAEKRGLTRLTLTSTATAHRFYLERGFRDRGPPEAGPFKGDTHPMEKALSYKGARRWRSSGYR